jgi:hypothetical protein
MIELLNGLRTATLNSKQLRGMAFELASGSLGSRIPAELEVLERICDQNGIYRSAGQSIELLAEKVCAKFGYQFDSEKDFETNSRHVAQLSEHFWRKIVSHLKGEPWIFICNYAENAASAVHNDLFGITYGFHENVTTWRGLVASGTGTYVIFYNTSDAPHSKMSYSSCARIEKIEESSDLDEKGRRHWKAKLSDFHMLTPVPVGKIEIEGRNTQHGIQAVTFDTFRRIVGLGKGGDYFNIAEEGETDVQTVTTGSFDLNDVLNHGPSLDQILPNLEVLSPSELDESMSEKESKADRAISNSRKNTRNLDKQTETQAVEIALAYLSSQSWELLHDNQRDGVGYDFEFTKNGESLLIEVKGIRGSKLEFNMTAREFFVCSSKKNFRLIAVTNALEPENYKIRVLFPADIFQMRRRVIQYRLTQSRVIG